VLRHSSSLVPGLPFQLLTNIYLESLSNRKAMLRIEIKLRRARAKNTHPEVAK